ncbi:MAG: RyR domain-containing protein [Roseiarcus sp.]
MVGAGLVKSSEPQSKADASAEEIRAYLEFHVERLAEEEHSGWMEERFASGWRYGSPRDNVRKLHPLLVDYIKLPSEQKAKDRDAVRNIPEIAAKAGYRIVWLRA